MTPRGSSGGLLLVAACVLLVVGCSTKTPGQAVAASAGDKLQPGTTYSADLDGDGTPESILVGDARLTITDGDAVYHSREKWQIVDSSLGDVDHDSLLEVDTLVDDEQGRHIGLFAYFGGEYRERIVTSKVVPAPAALAVCNGARPGPYAGLVPSGLEGDLIVLTQRPAGGQGEPVPRLYRWNGFGFTELLAP
jgi:hypothetical protein